MPANYTHTTRSDSQDATFYNDDHQNHITNRVPALLDDYSLNVAQMKLASNPGDSGSEILAISIAKEIEQLRHMLSVLKNKNNWYPTPSKRVDQTFLDGALAYKSVNQTLTTGTPTILSFANEQYDNSGYHNAVNDSRLTIPITGRYRLTFAALFAVNSVGVAREVDVLKNGATVVLTHQVIPTINQAPSCFGTFILDAVAADFFELRAFQDSGANLDVLGVSATDSVTFFSIERML